MDELRAILRGEEPDGAPSPLPVLYGRCHAVYTQQDRLVTSKDADLIDAAINLYSRTETAVDSLGVFSSNEDKDDLATADIKYLLVPFYRGSLLSAAPVRTDNGTNVSASRLAVVSAALSALASFVQRCDQYDMLGPLGISAVNAAASDTPMDPAAKRTFKVEKFKREKALHAATGALEARRAAAAAQEREDDSAAVRSGGPSLRRGGEAAGSSAAAVSASSGGGGGGGGGLVLDEEDERQLWEWRVELAVLQALDLQTALKQEVELLRHSASRESAAGPGPSSSAAGGAGGRIAASPADAPGEAERAELMARLRNICRDLDGSRKEQIRQNVFKPGHTLPTMTVEEAGEIEMQEAVEREARQKRQEEKERARRAALDSDEEDAEDKTRQRAFDDWSDAHPKGYGNSKLRPCG